jgi:hypothetical protein
MLVVGIAVLKKLRQVTAAFVTEKVAIAADHVRDLHEGALLEFHNCPTTLSLNLHISATFLTLLLQSNADTAVFILW